MNYIIKDLQAAVRGNSTDPLDVMRKVGAKHAIDAILHELHVSKNDTNGGGKPQINTSHREQLVAHLSAIKEYIRNHCDPAYDQFYEAELLDIVCSIFGGATKHSIRTSYGFLKHLHRALMPGSYLEIGVARGRSLAVSRTKSIGVDPKFVINSELSCDVQRRCQSVEATVVRLLG